MAAQEKTVLLIEPDEAVRSALEALLTQAGWTVSAFEGAGCLQLILEEQHPRVLVSESNLPDIDAKSVLEIAKKHTLPVIFLGHEREVQNAVDLVRKGAADFLEKPFPQSRLVDILKELTA